MRCLKLKDKIEHIAEQHRQLIQGIVPPGVKPFKVGIEVPELDTILAAESRDFSLVFDDTITYRMAKERLHFHYIAASKSLDLDIMRAQ